MQNINLWQPARFVYRKGRLTNSSDLAEVIAESRFAVKIAASFYDKYLRLFAKGRLLDLGCGKVPLYAAYKDYIEENICVDWGGSFHKNPYLDLEHDLNEDIPFNDSEFDTILLSDVLEHIRNPEKLWQEMNRVLKPGGTLIMNVPFFYWLHEVPHDYFRYTEFALEAFARNNNFEVKVLENMGGYPEVLTDLVAKISMRIPLAGKWISLSLQSFSIWFIRTGFGRRVSKNSGRVFPFGYFMVAQKK